MMIPVYGHNQDEMSLEESHDVSITPVTPYAISTNTLPSPVQRSLVPDSPVTPISNVSRSTNEEEIQPASSETPSIISLGTDTENSGIVALQRQSDATTQSRLSMLITCSLLAAFGGLTIGYATNVMGGAITYESLMIRFSREVHKKAVKAYTSNFCTYVNITLIGFSSIVLIVAIPFVWVAHGLIRYWGWKPVLILVSILHIVGSILVCWFPNNVVASIGLSLMGCSVAFLRRVIPMICREISVGNPQRWISLGFSLMIIWGSTATKGVSMAAYHDFRYGWRWSFASSGLFALPVLALSFFPSETPTFLIEKGRIEEAKVILKKLRKNDGERELQLLVDTKENRGKGKPKLLPSPLLVVNIVTIFFQQVLGLDSILFFGPFFLFSIGYSYEASFIAPSIAGVVRAGVASFTYSIYYLFSRRRTLVFACVGMLLAQVCLLGLFLIAGDPVFLLNPRSANIGISCAIVLIVCYSLFSGPCDWNGASYPNEIRERCESIELTISLMMSLFMNPAVLLLLCALQAWTFAIFAAMIFCTGFIIYKFLPEAQKEDGEPEAIWRQHWFWKRFLPKNRNVVVV